MPRASRRCPDPSCDLTVPCPKHGRPWASSSRRQSLPSDWQAIRARILERDPTCQLAYPDTWPTARGVDSCTGVALEVDHIGDADDHRPHMLRGVCPACHRRRTLEQAAHGRRRR